MNPPILYGAEYSVYTRIARLALHEKGAAYAFEQVDIFAEGGPPDWYRAMHPFARIPALRHGDLTLYETAAIARYVDEAFAGPALQPPDAAGRARVAQLVGILDAYAYRPMVWDIYVERVRKPQRGEAPDEARIAAALAQADRCLGVLAAMLGAAPWIDGGSAAPTLADLHAAPIIAYLCATPEGGELFARHPALVAWFARMAARPSMLATPSPLLEPSA